MQTSNDEYLTNDRKKNKKKFRFFSKSKNLYETPSSHMQKPCYCVECERLEQSRAQKMPSKQDYHYHYQQAEEAHFYEEIDRPQRHQQYNSLEYSQRADVFKPARPTSSFPASPNRSPYRYPNQSNTSNPYYQNYDARTAELSNPDHIYPPPNSDQQTLCECANCRKRRGANLTTELLPLETQIPLQMMSESALLCNIL